MFNAIKNMFAMPVVQEVLADPVVVPEKGAMSSLDFLNSIINPAREAHGERPVRNNDFIARIEDELDDLTVTKLSQPPRGGTPQRYYDLTVDQMMVVGMRESKAVRQSVLATLKELENKAITPVLTQEQLMAQAYIRAIEIGAQQEAVIEEQQKLLM